MTTLLYFFQYILFSFLTLPGYIFNMRRKATSFELTGVGGLAEESTVLTCPLDLI